MDCSLIVPNRKRFPLKQLAELPNVGEAARDTQPTGEPAD